VLRALDFLVDRNLRWIPIILSSIIIKRSQLGGFVVASHVVERDQSRRELVSSSRNSNEYRSGLRFDLITKISNRTVSDALARLVHARESDARIVYAYAHLRACAGHMRAPRSEYADAERSGCVRRPSWPHPHTCARLEIHGAPGYTVVQHGRIGELPIEAVPEGQSVGTVL